MSSIGQGETQQGCHPSIQHPTATHPPPDECTDWMPSMASFSPFPSCPSRSASAMTTTARRRFVWCDRGVCPKRAFVHAFRRFCIFVGSDHGRLQADARYKKGKAMPCPLSSSLQTHSLLLSHPFFLVNQARQIDIPSSPPLPPLSPPKNSYRLP